MKLLQQTLDDIAPVSAAWREAARERIKELTMPRWALGRLLDLAVDLAAITESLAPPTGRKELILMAADHGIVADGVAPQPSAVTLQMLANFARGGAAVNVLARQANAHVTLVDMGVAAELPGALRKQVGPAKIAFGTASFAHGPAMSRAQAVQAVETGIALVETMQERIDLFATGEMGIGNTSPSTAIVSVLENADPAELVGPGAGLPPEKLAHKASVIRQGIRLNRPDPADGLDLLAKVGGFEIGGIAGVILGAARRHKPVLVDGFISGAGALIASLLAPAASDYMIMAHGSAEPGHAAILKRLGKKPLLDLEMRLGEGSGAVLAMPLADAAAAILRDMATFAEAQVTEAGL